jgi:hypothetical protein
MDSNFIDLTKRQWKVYNSYIVKGLKEEAEKYKEWCISDNFFILKKGIKPIPLNPYCKNHLFIIDAEFVHVDGLKTKTIMFCINCGDRYLKDNNT